MIGARPIAYVAIGAAASLPAGIAGPAPVYFSDRGITFEPDDPRWPNRHFHPRVEQAFSFARAIPVSPLDGNRVVPIAGMLSLLNTDAGLDAMVAEQAIDGREVEVLIGAPSQAGNLFETLFKGTAAGWRVANPERIELDLRDLTWSLDRPIQANLYAGTGGLEGGADLAGVPKPLCFGRVFNARLELIDPANLLYQAHDGLLQEVTGCYVMGAALTDAGQVDDIEAAVVPPGHFMWQRQGGYVKLGSTPNGAVTADLIGDAEWGQPALNTSQIVYRILRHRLGLGDDLMNGVSFQRLRLAWPGEVGYFVPAQPVSAIEVINRLLQPIMGFMVQGRDGRLKVGTLNMPASGPSRASIDENDILEIGRTETPDAVNPPYWRVTATWGRNWYPMSASDIAGEIIETQPERYAFLSGAGRVAFWEEPTVRVRHPQAQEVFVDSLFAEAGDALDLVQRIGAMFGTLRQFAKVRLIMQGYLLEENDTIQLRHPRYGLGGGKAVLVVGHMKDLQLRGGEIDVMW
jgi:hypothetical protein